jgi:8-oxo-dGTP pyrophosphatase MutT (NUDIX family)
VYRRAVAYVLRGRELLVFEHRDFPDAGTQVPAGTVEDDEAPDVAVVREVYEETGVFAQLVRELGFTDEIAPRGEPRRNHFFELETDEPRDAWEHLVRGGGGDDGLVFACRLVPLTPRPALIADGDFLDAL